MRKILLALFATTTLALSGCGYNTFQSGDEQVKASWSEVLNQYRRRADPVPNLVNTAKGYAKYEQDPSNLTAMVGYSAKANFAVADEKSMAAPQVVDLGGSDKKPVVSK